MNILVTGAAGFIGMHVSKALLDRGDEVIGIDNLNDYYEDQLKLDRLNLLKTMTASPAPYRVYNIGNNEPVQLMEFIETIENSVGKKAEKNMMGMQNGDVVATYANIDALIDAVGFKPSTPLKGGIQKFVDWYKKYHGYN